MWKKYFNYRGQRDINTMGNTNKKNQGQELIEEVLHIFYLPSQKFSLSKITTGFVNTTYLVNTPSSKFVLRQSNPHKTLKHLQLETELLEYLKKEHFAYTARIMPNIKGHNITKYKGHYFTLQTFIKGSIKASWQDVRGYTTPIGKNHFKASALFSLTAKNFPKTKELPNTGIEFQLKTAFKKLPVLLKKAPEDLLIKKLCLQKSWLLQLTKETQTALKKFNYSKLPKQLVHFDLHPGNFHFVDNRVSGLFDFDWIRLDSRLADIASTIGQSCYETSGPRRAKYDKRKIQTGLKAYSAALQKNNQLSPTEIRLLPWVLKGYMIFQLLWTLEWYITNYKEPKAALYLQFFFDILKQNDFNKLFNKF